MPTVDEIASQYLGGQPNASPNDQVAAQAATQAAQSQKSEDKAAVQAQEAVAAASTPSENPVAYTVDFDGEKRTFTPDQIKGTFQRYTAMNEKNAKLKPVLSLAEKLMESGASGEQVAMAMVEALKLASKAKAAPQAQPEEDEPDDDDLTTWEKDNAASLPPGYKKMHKSNKTIMDELKKTQAMLASVLQASQGVATAAAQQGQQVRQASISNAKQQMAINLTKAQQAHGLPDESANDFMTFAAERGFTLEDFVNPELAYQVVGDFKNAMNSPEMERLRGIAQKRAAYTQSLGSTPSTGGTAPQQSSFDALASSVMARKNAYNS